MMLRVKHYLFLSIYIFWHSYSRDLVNSGLELRFYCIAVPGCYKTSRIQGLTLNINIKSLKEIIYQV